MGGIQKRRRREREIPVAAVMKAAPKITMIQPDKQERSTAAIPAPVIPAIKASTAQSK